MAKEFSNLNALKLFLLPSPQLHSHDTSDNNCWLGPLWALGHESFLVSQITPWHICVIWPSLTIHLLSTLMQFSNHEIIPKSNFIYFWFLDFSNWIWPILHPRIVWWKLKMFESAWSYLNWLFHSSSGFPLSLLCFDSFWLLPDRIFRGRDKPGNRICSFFGISHEEHT